jgi:hypothetical protein
MKPIVRNILAVIAGWIAGGAINSFIVQIGHTVYPMDIASNDMEAFAAFLENADSKYFIFPFIAHALGTLVGAFVAALISTNRKAAVALTVGVFFLLGGITMSLLVPAPNWFIAMDLIAAYIPMALLGAFVARSLRRK